MIVLICGLSLVFPWALPSSGAEDTELVVPRVHVHRGVPWISDRTESFRTYARCSAADSHAFAALCEQQRARLRKRWDESGDSSASWNPPCVVCVHCTRHEYRLAVGPCSGHTSAGCMIQRDQGRVVLRRIDLCAEDPEWLSSGLPHELTHLVVADIVGEQGLPSWADEGMAVLGESHARRMALLARMKEESISGRPGRLHELLDESRSVSIGRDALSYGRSWLIVSALVDRGGSSEFFRFLRQARLVGVDRALREVYRIDGVDELDRLWRTEAGGRTGQRTIFAPF